jgi:cytidylate kinase
MRIAIDGPSGAGKSSLAKELARRLSLAYVDTGALYRTVGLYASRTVGDVKDADAVAASLDGCEVSIRFIDGDQHVFLGDEDVSGLIRTPEASMNASAVSAQPKVREFLLGVQKDMAKKDGVIMDGRDIGTVIMPDADCKMFVFASAKARAERRYKELIEKGQDVCFDDVLADIEKRDKNDRERDIAPCVPADDAILLDNSEINFEQTVDAALKIIAEKAK